MTLKLIDWSKVAIKANLEEDIDIAIRASREGISYDEARRRNRFFYDNLKENVLCTTAPAVAVYIALGVL